MDVRESYDEWSKQYDSNKNKTRDLEAIALRKTLAGYHFADGLEVGCGTGKNTLWLQNICDQLVAIDLSAEMLSIAKKKVASENVTFLQADINSSWDFTSELFNLITFSLVLEHIKELETVFYEAFQKLRPGGLFISVNYILLNNIPERKQGLRLQKECKLSLATIIMFPILQKLRNRQVLKYKM
jgi:ubiquinone/menaquinone biosynthesis C-methylase UbiE